MTTIRIVRLTSGEELIGEYTKTETGITIKDPCVLIPSQEGKLLFVRWLPYAKTEEGISISDTHVMFVLEAQKELQDHYTGAITNNLFVPKSKLATPSLSLAT
jgi:hypothetical protein